MDDLGLNYDVEEMINGLSRKHKISKAQVKKMIFQSNKEIPPTSPARALYNFFRQLYPANVPLPMSHLRADTLLDNNSEINFAINATDNTGAGTLKTERKLVITNTFEVLDISLRIYTIPTTAGVPNVKFQTRKLYTYVNPFIFAGANEADALQSLFNSGKLIYRLDNETLYPAIDCNRFEKVPTTQEGTITTVTDAGVVVGRALRDGIDSGSNFIENIPSNTLNGNGQNTYSVQLPEAIDMNPPAGQNRLNYACLVLRGFEGISGTKQTNRKVGV